VGKGRLLALPYTRSPPPRKREEDISIYKSVFFRIVITIENKKSGQISHLKTAATGVNITHTLGR